MIRGIVAACAAIALTGCATQSPEERAYAAAVDRRSGADFKPG